MDTTHRYLAHLTFETTTPLAVGSGRKGLTSDRLVARDALDLPYVPGTSLAGVLRHALAETTDGRTLDDLFGYQRQCQRRADGRGSRLLVSDAHLLGADGTTVLEGLADVPDDDAYVRHFRDLPERDHVRLNDRGTVDERGKFDEQVVYRGTRFACRLELMGTDADADRWNQLLHLLHAPQLRLGGGTRKGFGAVRVVACCTRTLDLTCPDDLQTYLDTSSALNQDTSGWERFRNEAKPSRGWYHYRLRLTPEDFFLFGGSLGDQEVDLTYKTESCFVWTDGRPTLTENRVLVPATSVKGALAHRVAYHYNRRRKVYAGRREAEAIDLPACDEAAVEANWQEQHLLDTANWPSDDPRWEARRRELSELSAPDALRDNKAWQAFEEELERTVANYRTAAAAPVGERNGAVRALFGYALDHDEAQGQRGRVLLSDVFLKPGGEKVFNHVRIDRFTGGALDGALFQHRAAATDAAFTLDLHVAAAAFADAPDVRAAFEAALKDLCTGALPLGGGTNRGHGGFRGEWKLLNDSTA